MSLIPHMAGALKAQPSALTAAPLQPDCSTITARCQAAGSAGQLTYHSVAFLSALQTMNQLLEASDVVTPKVNLLPRQPLE